MCYHLIPPLEWWRTAWCSWASASVVRVQMLFIWIFYPTINTYDSPATGFNRSSEPTHKRCLVRPHMLFPILTCLVRRRIHALYTPVFVSRIWSLARMLFPGFTSNRILTLKDAESTVRVWIKMRWSRTLWFGWRLPFCCWRGLFWTWRMWWVVRKARDILWSSRSFPIIYSDVKFCSQVQLESIGIPLERAMASHMTSLTSPHSLKARTALITERERLAEPTENLKSGSIERAKASQVRICWSSWSFRIWSASICSDVGNSTPAILLSMGRQQRPKNSTMAVFSTFGALRLGRDDAAYLWAPIWESFEHSASPRTWRDQAVIVEENRSSSFWPRPWISWPCWAAAKAALA